MIAKSTNEYSAIGSFLRTTSPWSNYEEKYTIEKHLFAYIENGRVLCTVAETISDLTQKVAKRWKEISPNEYDFASALRVAIYNGGYNDMYALKYWAKHHILLIPSAWLYSPRSFYDSLVKAFIQVVKFQPKHSTEIKLDHHVAVDKYLLTTCQDLEKNVPVLEWYSLAIQADHLDGLASDLVIGFILNKIEDAYYDNENEDEE